MDASNPAAVLSSLSEALVETANRLAPGLLSLRAGRWRTTAFRFGDPGLWLAAAHAVEGVESATATVSGADAAVMVVGRDESLDLALLELPDVGGALPWTDRVLRSGELVLGLSQPSTEVRTRLGQVVAVGGRSVTAMGGKLESTVELSWLGRNPLTTLIADVEGHAVGLAVGGRRGFVLTTAMLERAVEQMRRVGRVRRGYLGIVAQPVQLPTSQSPRKVGLMVTGVEEQSPAESGGLLLGDILVGISGERIDSLEDLWTALGPEKVGSRVDLEVLRAGATQQVQVQLGSRP